MLALAQRETKALIALHGWSAVVLGLLLYAVVVTGSVAVLSNEIKHWSVGDVKYENPFHSDVDSIVKQLAKDVEPVYLEDIALSKSTQGNLDIFFHTHRTKTNGQPEEYGVKFEVDPVTYTVLGKTLGTGEEIHHQDQHAALSQFLVAIHTELHLPRPWGLLLTGILGLVMLVGAVSGFMMHRHLFTDMFLLRRASNDVLVKRDIHTVAGTWGLPFAFILSFTGSFFSFAGAFGLPAMAMVAFGGDQAAMIRTLVGVPQTKSNDVADTAKLNTIINDGFARVNHYPESVSITHYGRADAQVLLFLTAPDSKLEPVQLEYNGMSGEFTREKPSLGTVTSAGSIAFSLVAPLHFGNFAGLLSRLVWVALGFACAYVIMSGFSLWLVRRGPSWNRFACFVRGIGTGLPISILTAAVCYFAALLLGWNPVTCVPIGFLTAALFILLYSGLAKSADYLHRNLLLIAASLCFLLPLFRIGAGGPMWFNAISNNNAVVVMIDCLLLACGFYTVWIWKRTLKIGFISINKENNFSNISTTLNE